jgi:hypothetical protein
MPIETSFGFGIQNATQFVHISLLIKFFLQPT